MQFFIFPIPVLTFYDLGSVVGAFAGEDWGKKIEYLSLLYVLHNQLFQIPPERSHIP